MSYVSSGGDFNRDTDYITTRITADGRDGYPVEAGFYEMYRDPSISKSRSVPRTALAPFLNAAVFDYPVGRISPSLNIGGAYLIFINFKYTPYSEPQLGQPAVASKVNNVLYEAVATGPIAEYKYDLWFGYIEDNHEIEIFESGLEAAIKSLNSY